MRKFLGAGLACAALLAGTVLAATPAAATGTDGPLCRLNSNAYQYDWNSRGEWVHERTVHAGHNFRKHAQSYDGYGRLWAYGHSGESWQDDGWILHYHLNC